MHGFCLQRSIDEVINGGIRVQFRRIFWKGSVRPVRFIRCPLRDPAAQTLFVLRFERLMGFGRGHHFFRIRTENPLNQRA